MNFTVNLDAVETLFCRRQMQQSDIRALTDRLLSASENTSGSNFRSRSYRYQKPPENESSAQWILLTFPKRNKGIKGINWQWLPQPDLSNEDKNLSLCLCKRKVPKLVLNLYFFPNDGKSEVCNLSQSETSCQLNKSWIFYRPI